MKQVLQNFNTGHLGVYDVPDPLLQPGGVLVRTHYSLISAGTEGGTARLAKKSLIGKALSRPDLVAKVMKVAQNDGVMAAYDAVTSNLDAPVPMGYSLAGEVVEVGKEATEFKVGDRVACFGAFVANHAEINYIPKNMCVPLPDGIDMKHAAFGMLGAIALNGVRRTQTELGSTVAVIGLGLLGNLAAQLLRAAGCRVFGIDIDSEKVQQMRDSGFEAMPRSSANIEETVAAFSDGLGVDATLITAATSSTDPVELAGRITRRRGRVVAIGRVPYELPRDTYLFQEIDFITAMAFGPGVNDVSYEQKGQDYPAAFVRWTGKRNVQAFSQLIVDGKLDIDPLITHEYSLTHASDAYQLLTDENSDENPIGIILEYDVSQPYQRQSLTHRTTKHPQSAVKNIGVGIVGAGSHAVSYMFDAITSQDITPRGIMSASGFRAGWYADKYDFAYVASDMKHLIEDEKIHVIFILSRHDSHADLTVQALQAGKHVFVEKPLCLKEHELNKIIAAKETGNAQLMVGYNRRYATMGRKLQQAFIGRQQPMSAIFRGNIGVRPADHWLHDLDVGGGLILGEATHFIDYLQFVIGAAPTTVWAHSVHSQTGDIIDADTVSINITYADGSIGTVHYFSNGDSSLGRERVEVYADNRIGIVEDWRSITISKGGNQDTDKLHFKQDKGFQSEISEFIEAIHVGRPIDMTFDSIVWGQLVAFAALESLRQRRAIEIESGL